MHCAMRAWNGKLMSLWDGCYDLCLDVLSKALCIRRAFPEAGGSSVCDAGIQSVRLAIHPLIGLE